MSQSNPTTHVNGNRTCRWSPPDVVLFSSTIVCSISIVARTSPFVLRSTLAIRDAFNDGNVRASDLTYWINYILLRQNTIPTAASESVDGCSVLGTISSPIACRWTDEFCVNIKRVQWTKTTNKRGCDGRELCVGVSTDSTISVCDTSLWWRLLSHRRA
jgi:hypothetical protein